MASTSVRQVARAKKAAKDAATLAAQPGASKGAQRRAAGAQRWVETLGRPDIEVAKDPSSSAELLESIAAKASPPVIKAILSHPNCNAKTRRKLSFTTTGKKFLESK